MDHLPVFLNIRGKLVLIVGGGEVARRKGLLMKGAGARLRIVAPQVHPELATAGEVLLRPAQASDFSSEVELAVLATDSLEVQERFQKLCREKRIWCNRCDEPEDSDFNTGSVCDRQPVVAAVTSTGCPGISRLLRQRIDQVITPEIVELAKVMVEIRSQVKAHFPTQAERAAFFRHWANEETIQRVTLEGITSVRKEIIASLSHR